MKTLIALVALGFLTTATAAPVARHFKRPSLDWRLVYERRDGQPESSRVEVLLGQWKNHIVCSTSKVPEHYLKLAEYPSLLPPFKAAHGPHPAAGCREVLHWTSPRGAEISTCYKRGSFPVAERIFARCTAL